MDLKAFGGWLRGERERRGMSRQQVLARGGPSISTQQTYEEGGRVWKGQWQDVAYTDRTLVQLAAAIGLDVEEVFRRLGRELPSWAGSDPTLPGMEPRSGPAMSGTKWERLSASQRRAIETLVDEMLGEEPT